MDGFLAHHRARLALADSLRAAMYLAQAEQDEKLEHEARELLARLAADRFTLAVVGGFSRGKSTLMNAILGGPYLPTGVAPMTSVVTTVTYGSRERATFRRSGRGMDVEIPLSEVPALVAQNSSRRAELAVAAMDIELPVELLRLGFAFVDTPGVGSGIGVNSATTWQFLPRTDAAIFVTSIGAAPTADEIDLLRQLIRQETPVFGIMNKADLATPQQLDEDMSVLADLLTEAGVQRPELFAGSALDAVTGRSRGDGIALAASGVPALESALDRFLREKKSAVFLGAVAARALDFVIRANRDLCIGRGRRARAAEIDRLFSVRVDEVARRQASSVAELRGRLNWQLDGLLDASAARWQQDLVERIRPALAAFAPPTADHPITDHPTAGDEFARATAETIRTWTATQVSAVNELLVGVVSEDLDRIYAAAASPSLIGAAIAGAALPQDVRPRESWTLADLPRISVPVIDWTVKFSERDWIHVGRTARESEARRRLETGVEAAIDTVSSQLRSRLAGLCVDWLDAIAADAVRRRTADAARFRSHLRQPLSREDATAFDELVDTVCCWATDIARMAAEPTVSAPEKTTDVLPAAAVPAATERQCDVCVAVREALLDFLSHTQYRLATRQNDQARHARGHGFCPTHTWLYHGIASPVGIASGYAPLAARAAELLTAAAVRDGSATELAESVEALLVPTEQCPACAAMAKEEDAAVRQIVNESDMTRIPVLCAAHTVRVLPQNPNLETARKLVLALAFTLGRDSEDMRSFALKREALSRWLITSEESRAYRETLRLLAGDPLLARAGTVDKEIEFSADADADADGDQRRQRAS